MSDARRPTEPLGRSPAIGPRVPALDGLRGVAILLVVGSHFGYFEESSDSIVMKLMRSGFTSGWIGVQLFFVLSGFLITGILLDTKHRPHYFRSFYLRRVLRIFPLYYLALAVAFLVLPRFVDLGAWGERARHVQVWYWTYLSNWSDPIVGTLPGLSHFWSLAVEEQFYLVWPLIVLALSPGGLLRTCGVLIAMAFAVRVLMVAVNAPPMMPYNYTIARCDGLACGAVIAVAVRDALWYRRIVSWRRLAMAVLLGMIVLVAIAQRGLGWATPWSLTVGQSALALLFGLVVLSVVDPSVPDGWLRRAAEARWLRFFGKYSYGLYVVHPPIHRLASYWLAPWVVAGTRLSRPVHLIAYVAAGLAVSTAVAVAVWHLVERRFLALKDVLAPRAMG